MTVEEAKAAIADAKQEWLEAERKSAAARLHYFDAIAVRGLESFGLKIGDLVEMNDEIWSVDGCIRLINGAVRPTGAFVKRNGKLGRRRMPTYGMWKKVEHARLGGVRMR